MQVKIRSWPGLSHTTVADTLQFSYEKRCASQDSSLLSDPKAIHCAVCLTTGP
jgi:hypothetical protein